jgi:hypothetical protein
MPVDNGSSFNKPIAKIVNTLTNIITLRDNTILLL